MAQTTPIDVGLSEQDLIREARRHLEIASLNNRNERCAEAIGAMRLLLEKLERKVA